MNFNDEDLLDIITRQRLTIYHQERRIEALDKELSQATQPKMTNDLVNQLFNQLQTSNELMALKAKCERLEAERVHDLNQIGGLQQELASLRASSFVTAVPCEQYERVVKAGDAMAELIAYELRIDEGQELPESVQHWNAAKGGKPSV